MRFDKEFRDIQLNISQVDKKNQIKIATRLGVRSNDLQIYLNQERPNIVHFTGHGTDEGILLENEVGNSKIVKSDALATIFKAFNDDIKCVVLNSCFSTKHAPVIAKDIDCVVGMSIAISDETAIKFSTGFYLAIASGKSIQNAFDQGIARIKLESIPEEYVPKLFCINGKDPSKIFLNKSISNNSHSVIGNLSMEEVEVIVRRLIREREKPVTVLEVTRLEKVNKVWIVEGAYSKQIDQSGREWAFYFKINLNENGAILLYNSNS